MGETIFVGIKMIRPDIFEQMKMDALGSISPNVVQPVPTGFPLMLASNDVGSLAERSQMADIESQTGVNINPYNVRPSTSQVQVDSPRKTISYEEARAIERQMMEERRKEALRRKMLNQEATISKRDRSINSPLPPSNETLNAELLFRNRD